MSDIMLFGVLRMPYELAMGDEIARLQYWHRGQEAAARIEKLEAALRRARDDMASWASYASKYTQEKWDLAGDLANIDAALEDRG